MDNIKLNILRHYYDNGKVNLNVLADHFRYDLTNEQFKIHLTYLIGKKYLRPCEGDVTHELSDIGRQTVVDTLAQQKFESQRQTTREYLEIENLKLQNDNLKYQTSLRDKQSKIDRLTAENLKLHNRQLRWQLFISIIGFICGVAVTKYKELWTVLKSILQ